MGVLLYNQSCYTLLSSTLTIHQLVKFCLENKMDSIALTDHNVMFGALEFYKECKKNNIKPIIGLETNVKFENDLFSVLLYAKDDQGYSNLMNISSYLCSKNDFLTLEQFNNITDHLIKIINYNHGYLYKLVSNNQMKELENYLDNIQDDNNIYIGFGSNLKPYNQNINNILITECQKRNIPTVALDLALYKDEKSFESYKVIKAIKQNVFLDDISLKYDTDCHLKNNDYLNNYFNVESVKNTEYIASLCNVEMKLKKATLPIFQNKANIDSKNFLRQLCIAGLNKRFNSTSVPKSYVDRLNYELETIINMKFEDYFLIVTDLINYAHKNNIYVGPGRGSCVGSLVAYCLGITHLDPLKYGLLFERFLNAERVSMPDIDIDFPDDKREEMIEYTISKYGFNNTAHILTFGTLASKQVIKDVGKVLRINDYDLDIICRNIEDKPKITLDYCYENNEKFKTAINSSVQNQKLFVLAKQLEGLPRHIGTHASGIIISSNDLTDNIPVINLSDKMYTTQYTMEYLEEQGLIKLDFLGLRNLTIISNICEEIKKNEPMFNILKVSLNDEKTYKMIQDGNTSGVFQLESDGMRSLIKKLQPKSFDDLAILIALFRPGPMQNINLYLENRNNPNNIIYLHNDLKPILASTSGIMIYQEQVMQVAKQIAGFSLNQADILRKAISKKKEEEMIDLKEKFYLGAKAKGYDEKIVIQIYDLIMKFADYGFNKSHSYGYSLLAYQLAYLKSNYPLAFYQEVLNSVIGNTIKTNEYYIEAKHNNIKFLPLDINYSSINFVKEKDEIRLPLTCIKSIGEIIAKTIIEERNKNGYYSDYFDFVARMEIIKINKKIIENLINSGALDCFNLSHLTMLENYNEVLRYANLCTIYDEQQTRIDFELISKPILVNYSDNKNERLKKEYELLGFYINGHPTEEYYTKYPDCINSLKLSKYNGKCKTICQVTNFKQIRTKNGDLMCFITGEDMYGKIELALMPNIYELYIKEIKKGIIILVEGIKDQRDSIKITRMQFLER